MSEWQEIAAECDTEIWPARQKGGQHVGPGPQGVKVTHRDTGIVACCDIGRSQFRNREIALDMIVAALTHPKIGSWSR